MIKRLLLVFPLVAICGCMSSPVGTPAVPSMAAGQSAEQASSQSIDAILDSAPQITPHVVKGPGWVAPATASAKSSTFLLNFVAASVPINGLPCFNCVNGTEAGTLGMPIPGNYVTANSEWVYYISYTSISFKGKCKLAWAITSGKKVIDKFGAHVPIGSFGVYFYYYARTHPKYSGPATLTGKATCGGKSQTATAPLVFQ
jgi:hypothetical protein